MLSVAVPVPQGHGQLVWLSPDDPAGITHVGLIQRQAGSQPNILSKAQCFINHMRETLKGRFDGVSEADFVRTLPAKTGH